jgi:hypothetical protein
MKPWFTLYFGIFSMMALSNAIVPVLPAYAGSSSLQGAIYAAYFLGAFQARSRRVYSLTGLVAPRSYAPALS